MARGLTRDLEGEFTEDDRRVARERVARNVRFALPFSVIAQIVVQILAGVVVTTQVDHLGGMRLVLAVALVSTVLTLPLGVVIKRVATDRGLEQLIGSIASERRLRIEARRREFERQLSNALEMAATEAEAMTAAGRALRSMVPDAHVEVLLADHSHAHLAAAVAAAPDHRGGGCSVETPDGCIAARRGQTQVFADSESLDACPKLAGREIGRCGAVCVPLSILSRTVGVVHVATPIERGGVDDTTIHDTTVDDTTVEQLETLADQLGARVGMVQMMDEKHLQASTDGLTGLDNRRSFENQVRQLRHSGTEFGLVLADLDNFKALNDAHGHEAGDRALRAFAAVLRSSLRSVDVACRYGGEEFALVLPDCGTDDARLACERIREALSLATSAGESPPFTSSFGITHSARKVPLEQLMARADSALYEAKRRGRNRAVVWEPTTQERTTAAHLV